MPRTKWHGPYHESYDEDLVVIRCKYPFKVIRTTEVVAAQQGIEYVSRPIATGRGVKLTLQGEGLPTVEIEGGNGGDAA